MSDPLSNFASLESEYKQLKLSISSKLSQINNNEESQQTTESIKSIIRSIQSELEEGDEILDSMELEAKSKAKLMILVRGFKVELKGFREQVKQLSSITDRQTLFSNSSTSNPNSTYNIDVSDDEIDAYTSRSATQRTKLLASTQTLNNSSKRLNNAERLALESEEIGGNVLGALRGQTSQLEETRDMLGEADGNIGKASSTIKKMVRQMYKQRIVLVVAIAVFGSLILLILYNKFK